MQEIDTHFDLQTQDEFIVETDTRIKKKNNVPLPIIASPQYKSNVQLIEYYMVKLRNCSLGFTTSLSSHKAFR